MYIHTYICGRNSRNLIKTSLQINSRLRVYADTRHLTGDNFEVGQITLRANLRKYV